MDVYRHFEPLVNTKNSMFEIRPFANLTYLCIVQRKGSLIAPSFFLEARNGEIVATDGSQLFESYTAWTLQGDDIWLVMKPLLTAVAAHYRYCRIVWSKNDKPRFQTIPVHDGTALNMLFAEFESFIVECDNAMKRELVAYRLRHGYETGYVMGAFDLE